MAADCTSLIHCLRLGGCGLVHDRDLSREEKLALHAFKNEVAALGDVLYATMPSEKADEYILKVVFGAIESRMKSMNAGG
jgi:hypothetical protein